MTKEDSLFFVHANAVENRRLGSIYYNTGRYLSAISVFMKNLEIMPTYEDTSFIFWSNYMLGRDAEIGKWYRYLNEEEKELVGYKPKGISELSLLGNFGFHRYNAVHIPFGSILFSERYKMGRSFYTGVSFAHDAGKVRMTHTFDFYRLKTMCSVDTLDGRLFEDNLKFGQNSYNFSLEAPLPKGWKLRAGAGIVMMRNDELTCRVETIQDSILHMWKDDRWYHDSKPNDGYPPKDDYPRDNYPKDDYNGQHNSFTRSNYQPNDGEENEPPYSDRIEYYTYLYRLKRVTDINKARYTDFYLYAEVVKSFKFSDIKFGGSVTRCYNSVCYQPDLGVRFYPMSNADLYVGAKCAAIIRPGSDSVSFVYGFDLGGHIVGSLWGDLSAMVGNIRGYNDNYGNIYVYLTDTRVMTNVGLSYLFRPRFSLGVSWRMVSKICNSYFLNDSFETVVSETKAYCHTLTAALRWRF